MLALVATLLLSQAPDAGPAEPAPPAPDFSACLALLEAGDPEGARACYAAHTDAQQATTDDEARIARELADVVSTLKLPAPAEELRVPAPANPLDVGALVTSGKAELMVTAALTGGYAAELMVWTLVLATGAINGAPPLAAGAMMLAPVGGGLAGLALATTLILALPQITAGDANIVRAFLLLGAYNSVLVALTGAAFSFSFGNGAPVAAGMLLAQGGATAAGIGVAAFLDLPEGAGAAAISGALWSSVLSMMVVNMFDGLKADPRPAPLVLAAAGNAGFVGGAALASTILPVSRADTWALDIGGAVGLLGGAALALGLRAPNPVLGYGAMAVGCTGGMVAGVASARLLPGVIDSLPQLVAVAPLVAPSVNGGEPPIGVALAGRF